MPPRRASIGAKKKITKTVRSARKPAAAAAETPPPEAAVETPTCETSPAAEAAAVETSAAAEEVTRASPAPDEITPQVTENPTMETLAADEPAATGDTTTAMEVDTTGPLAPEVTPQAAETPDATAAADAETAANETAAITEEVKVTTGCPAPEITPQAAGSEAEPADPGPAVDTVPGAAEGEDAQVVEPAHAAEAAPAAKKTTKRVRKVTRRVPVKRTPNKKEPEPAAGKEDKGDGEGEEMVPLPPASAEGEDNSNGAEAVSVSVEEGNSTGAETASMSVEGQNPKGAEAVAISVGEQKPVSCPDQESTPDVEAAGSAAATSADGASPAAVPQKRVRKVKKIVVVKRTVKAKGVSQKEEKMEEADGGAAEKVANLGSDAATNEPAKNSEPDVEVGAASLPDGSPRMEEDVLLESCKDDFEKGDSGRDVGAEQEKFEGVGAGGGSAGDQMMGMSEGQKRRKTEIFIGGLDRNAKEDDIRKVFEKVGEIVEVRMMMDKKTGKNKGYAFLRYATAAQAKQAVAEFTKVEVCGKQCGAAALEGNDTIFLGNIDKKWKKDDVIKLLHEIGIEKIDTVTLMPDPKTPDCNRGFAFLDFETNRDAQTAFKKLQKKDVFGKGRNIKVAWAEPLVDPDEEVMQKVKSVFAEGIPSSWDEKKVREHFKRFGQIERVVLSRNMHSAKRKDFAFVNFTTREAALSCIESFDEDLVNDGSKVNMKVSLAKPVQKNKQTKAGIKSNDKDSSKAKLNTVTRDKKINISVKSQSSRGAHGNTREDKLSTNHELLHVLREQAAWKQQSYPRGAAIPDYSGDLHGRKRPLSALEDNAQYTNPRMYPRARLDSAYPVAGPSYSSLSHSMAGTSLEYYQHSSAGYGTGSVYGAVDTSRTRQVSLPSMSLPVIGETSKRSLWERPLLQIVCLLMRGGISGIGE